MESRTALLRRIVVASVVQLGLFAAALFGPAGTWRWWQAWVAIALFAVLSVLTIAGLYPKHTAILEERLRLPVQKNQPPIDKILVTVLLVTYLGALVFIPLDVFRFHLLLGRPTFIVSLFGLGLVVAGWWIAYQTLLENAFAAPAVKHEQRQRVVDTGVYAVVRHPMYAGAGLVTLGMPLWLGSYAATVAAFAPIFMFSVRAVFEEEFLRRELAGYEAYMRRVRWRLVPNFW